MKDYRILCSEASFSASFGRSRFTAWGGAGGGGGRGGTPNYFVVSGSVNMRGGRRIGGLTLRRGGDVVSIRTGSGGGAWGGPAQERPRPLIERDLQWGGYIDAETAEKWGGSH